MFIVQYHILLLTDKSAVFLLYQRRYLSFHKSFLVVTKSDPIVRTFDLSKLGQSRGQKKCFETFSTYERQKYFYCKKCCVKQSYRRKFKVFFNIDKNMKVLVSHATSPASVLPDPLFSSFNKNFTNLRLHKHTREDDAIL